MDARKLVLALLMVILLVAAWASSGPYGRPEATPASPTAQYFSGQASGRPGVFRFYPLQEIQGDRSEVAELRAGGERLQALLPAVDDARARQELKAQLQRWQSHLNREEQRMRVSAGPTAAQVETRLNAMKGERTCAVCHGTENIGRNVPVSAGGEFQD